MSWGRRKDTNQPYIKGGRTGIKSSETNSVGDIHLKKKTEKGEGYHNLKIGDKIRILNENGNYDEWANKIWTINHIAHNRDEHQGYDEGVGGLLVSAKGLPVSLYEYEFEVV